MIEFLGFTIIALVSYYTFTYGLWVWRQKMRRGAVGLFVLAGLNLAAPVSVWLYHRLVR